MQNSINNIFVVPVNYIYFAECLEGRPAQGALESYILVEANSSKEAQEILKEYPNFADNWNKASVEKREAIIKRHKTPFKFRDEEIKKVFECPERFKNSKGEYICGKPLSQKYITAEDIENNYHPGTCGMCLLESTSFQDSPPEHCPQNIYGKLF